MRILFLSFLSLVTLLCTVAALVPPIRRDIGPSSPSSEDIDALLAAHNAIREEYAAPPLQWSDTMAVAAASWGGRCLFQPTGGVLNDEPYGELQVAATGPFPISAAIGQFVQDEGDYNPANPTYNHWTQIVWKSTENVGCAITGCNDLLGANTGLATYYICIYDPPGNVIGEAPENVQA